VKEKVDRRSAREYPNKKLLTLAIAVRDGKVLLAMKKRGFGEGWWNGYGGKLEPGEGLLEAAKRETEEEGRISKISLRRRGTMWFEFEGKSELLEIAVYSIKSFAGEPQETEEMRPEWFSLEDIPYDHMWPTDRHWLPFFLSGRKFEGYFKLTANKELLEYDVTYV